MNRSVAIAVGIGIVIILSVIIYQVNETIWKKTSVEEYYEKGGKVSSVIYPDNPQILGPLQINKDKYLLGEHVYVILRNLQPGDKGMVEFLTPAGVEYMIWKFDGSKQDFMKKYFKPQLLKGKNLCDRADLVGEWRVGFKGFDEAQIKFEILDEALPNQEWQFEDCNVAYEIDPTKIETEIKIGEPLKP